MMNIYEVNRRLKQRPPFQMIERVTELTPGEAAVGLKTVSVNDPWFAGHFPGEPILPGVLIIESCAQHERRHALCAAQGRSVQISPPDPARRRHDRLRLEAE